MSEGPGARGAKVGGRYIGKAVSRTEDRRFLTGYGHFVDDLYPQNVTYAVFVLSPHPHARVREINIKAALALPGVVAVLTGRDWVAAGRGKFVVVSPLASADNVVRAQITQPVLAPDKGCDLAQPLALLIAETQCAAQNTTEALYIQDEPLTAV